MSTLSLVCQLLKTDGLVSVSVKRSATEDINSDSDSDV